MQILACTTEAIQTCLLPDQLVNISRLAFIVKNPAPIRAPEKNTITLQPIALPMPPLPNHRLGSVHPDPIPARHRRALRDEDFFSHERKTRHLRRTLVAEVDNLHGQLLANTP